jgi:cellulose biosynthesis protein BcsQ
MVLDPQKSLTAWLADTKGFTPDPVWEITTIDTPPRIDDPHVLDPIRTADRILIPTTPSLPELATLRHSTAIVKEHRKPASKTVVVFNRVKRPAPTGKNLAVLSASLPLPPAKNAISNREAFKHVLLDG